MKASPLLSILLATLASHVVIAAEPPEVPSHPIATTTSATQTASAVRQNIAPAFTEMTATLHEDGSVVMNCREQHVHRDRLAPLQPMAQAR